jgi:hypothetical protein
MLFGMDSQIVSTGNDQLKQGVGFKDSLQFSKMQASGENNYGNLGVW